jgi:hypothetical protein
MIPQRVQLSRAKGWRMPPNTVKVDRSSRWGNPFRIEQNRSAEEAVATFAQWLKSDTAGAALAMRAKAELRGKNLACWCKVDAPCHADVLLSVSNDLKPAD